MSKIKRYLEDTTEVICYAIEHEFQDSYQVDNLETNIMDALIDRPGEIVDLLLGQLNGLDTDTPAYEQMPITYMALRMLLPIVSMSE